MHKSGVGNLTLSISYASLHHLRGRLTRCAMNVRRNLELTAEGAFTLTLYATRSVSIRNV